MSIIIPAYNEAENIVSSLEKLVSHLSDQPYMAEILVVDDGSQDLTGEVVKEYSAHHPLVSLIKNPHYGKGYAVKVGMLAARGEYRFQCDADLSMPVQELSRFLPPVSNHFDLAIGSREAAGAKRYNEPFYRHFMGRVFNLVVHLVGLRGFKDTQCGFKCFRGDVARTLFSLQTLHGFAFDVEILYLARKKGLTVVEVPISWHHRPESKVRPIRDTLEMLGEAISVRWRELQGMYEDR